jgi:hypothetical protein
MTPTRQRVPPWQRHGELTAAHAENLRNIAAPDALARINRGCHVTPLQGTCGIAEEMTMRNGLIAATALAALIGAPALAQAQDVTIGVAPSSGVVVSTPVEVESDGGIVVERRPAFREYVVRERIPTYTIEQRVIVGGTLPDDGVMTYDVPQTFGATPYRYTVVNGRTVLVEPRSRRIVQVID